MRFALGTIGAALIGGAIFVSLLPWGGPCSLPTPEGESSCELLSPGDSHVRNAVFFAVCIFIGLSGALLARRRRHLAGACSVVAAFFLAHFCGRWLYGLDPVQPDLFESMVSLQALIYVGVLAALGAIGAFLSRYVRLITRWREPWR